MQKVCSGCHGASWVDGHFKRLSATIAEVDAMTFTSTQLLFDAWRSGVADSANLFDEEFEKSWTRQWLFYGNSIRYASAMTGAFDYASFKNGWWDLNLNLQNSAQQAPTDSRIWASHFLGGANLSEGAWFVSSLGPAMR